MDSGLESVGVAYVIKSGGKCSAVFLPKGEAPPKLVNGASVIRSFRRSDYEELENFLWRIYIFLREDGIKLKELGKFLMRDMKTNGRRQPRSESG